MGHLCVLVRFLLKTRNVDRQIFICQTIAIHTRYSRARRKNRILVLLTLHIEGAALWSFRIPPAPFGMRAFVIFLVDVGRVKLSACAIRKSSMKVLMCVLDHVPYHKTIWCDTRTAFSTCNVYVLGFCCFLNCIKDYYLLSSYVLLAPCIFINAAVKTCSQLI
jgi:hypothetical protein